MLLPNKLFSYHESILAKLHIILRILKKHPCGVRELYLEVKPDFSGVVEYQEALDCLYALEAIDYDESCEVLYCVI